MFRTIVFQTMRRSQELFWAKRLAFLRQSPDSCYRPARVLLIAAPITIYARVADYGQSSTNGIPRQISFSFNSFVGIRSCTSSSPRAAEIIPTTSSAYDQDILELSQEKRFEDIKTLLSQILEREETSTVKATTFHAILSRCANDSKKNKQYTGSQTEALLTTMMAFRDADRIEEDEELDLTKLFTICIRAWARSGHPDSGARAESILDLIRQLSQDDSSLNLRTDTIIYTVVMNVYAKEGNIQGAFSIFHQMLEDYETGNETAKPDNFTFATLMKALTNSGSSDAGDRATALLDEMAKVDLKPDTVIYNAIMKGYATYGQVEGACRVFDIMVEKYKAGDGKAKPDSYTFGTIIKALAISRITDAGKQADAFIERMNEFDLEPDRDTLRFVKRCWNGALKDDSKAEEDGKNDNGI